MENYRIIHFYTDGSALGVTPDYIGGWGLLMVEENEDGVEEITYEEKGSDFPSTNNRMELYAIYRAIVKAKSILRECGNEVRIIIHSDSAYSLGIVSDWIRGWNRNNWKNSKGQEVANIDLVKLLWEEVRFADPRISYNKVKGHSGHEYNDRADALATEASAELKEELIREGVLDINGKCK